MHDDLIRKIFRDMVCGLEYLHYHNIIHRDLKPQNIMITDKWLVKIGDFGQATIFEGSDRQNKSLGTFQFFPPECCRPGTQEYSGKAADIWALGLTLYSIIYKKLPYAANSIIEIFDNILSFRLVFEPEIDKELEFLIRRLLDKNPETRIKLFEVLQDP
jgi:Serine/threonine protein kinase